MKLWFKRSNWGGATEYFVINQLQNIGSYLIVEVAKITFLNFYPTIAMHFHAAALIHKSRKARIDDLLNEWILNMLLEGLRSL